MSALVGIFVGGRGKRMHGQAKGLLPAPGSDQNLVQRLLTEARAALPEAGYVLVGHKHEYGALEIPMLKDAQDDCGPLGGLVALLLSAQARGSTQVYALACDMPFLSRASIQKLAAHPDTASAVAPRRDGVWEPLVARYHAHACLPIAQARLTRGALSLQGLLNELSEGCHAIELPTRELSDWDTPEDMQADAPGGAMRE